MRTMNRRLTASFTVSVEINPWLEEEEGGEEERRGEERRGEERRGEERRGEERRGEERRGEERRGEERRGGRGEERRREGRRGEERRGEERRGEERRGEERRGEERRGEERRRRGESRIWIVLAKLTQKVKTVITMETASPMWLNTLSILLPSSRQVPALTAAAAVCGMVLV